MLALIQLANRMGVSGAASGEGLEMATAPNDAPPSSMTPVWRRADVPVFGHHCDGIEAVSTGENKDRFKGTRCRMSKGAAILAEKTSVDGAWSGPLVVDEVAVLRSRCQVGVLVGGRFC